MPSELCSISLSHSKHEVTAALRSRPNPGLAALLGSPDEPVLAQDDVNFERKPEIPRAGLLLSPSPLGQNHRPAGGRGDR